MLYLNDRLQDFDLDEALALLSEQRREQALRFKHEAGRRACAAAYLLLCRGLREEYGITEKPVFCYGEHGKPFIVGHQDIHFNLSHCREAAACYVSDRPVGIDIEAIRPAKESLLRYTMSDSEVESILRSPQADLTFTSLWTKKEALVKLTGKGLVSDLKDLLRRHSDVSIETTVSQDGRYVYSIALKDPIPAYGHPLPFKGGERLC